MFIIDFRSSDEDIKSLFENRTLSAWEVPVFDFITAWFDGNINAFEVKTSGSTGTPKVISHTRKAMTASAVKTCDFFGLKEGDTTLLSLPASPIGGKMMILRSRIRKLQLICVEPKSDPLAQLDFEGEIDFASFTPMQMSMILDHPASAAKVSQIKKIILGGGEVSYALREKLQGISPEVYETYGMTETISHIALKKINGSDRSEYFTLLDGVQIKQDERGCLVISAPHLSADDIVTNDIVTIIDDNKFQWLGRYDNIINTGGIKISAEEIERKLQPYINQPFFVMGTADDVLGQQVTLLVEGYNRELKSEDMNKHLSKYEHIRLFIMFKEFVRTETGKINKTETFESSKGHGLMR